MALKARYHAQAAEVLRAGDREGCGRLAEDLPSVTDAVEALRQVWRRLWESTNKPFGFEVLDFRMGGIIARLKTAADRLAAYSRGEIDDIPELSGETFLLKRREDNSVSCTNTMAELLTAARLDHPF